MIPKVAHFIWLGGSFPWLHVVALRSAARRGGFEQVVFHHTHDLQACRFWPELRASRGVVTRRLDPEAVLESVPLSGGQLIDLYRELSQPAAQANILRVALLRQSGGVYLDCDTVTVDSLGKLCEAASAFCGSERLAFPAGVRPFRTPARFLAGLLRTTLRDGFRRLPNGHRSFRSVEHLFPVAANNAVLGGEPQHPLFDRLMQTMLALPKQARLVRYALGTAALQVTLRQPELAVTVLEPAAFYPLGPELSAHWFRFRERADLSQVLTKETLVVHWYSSVRTRKFVPKIDPQWVALNAHRQLISQLALPYVTD